MPNINDIVDITVSSSTRPTSTASFSNALFIASHNVFTERSRVYTSANSAISDGFDANSPVVQFLTGCFQGSQKPNNVIVGRRALSTITMSVDSVSEDEVYQLSVKVGTTVTAISYIATGVDTTSTVATSVAALIDAVTGVGAAAVGDVITLAPDVLTTPFTVYNITDNFTTSYVANAGETYTAAYTAISETLSTDAFFLAGDTRDEDDVQELFDIAASEKLFAVTASSDVNTYNSGDASNIAYYLNLNAYERGLGFFSAEAATSYAPEGALIGSWAATNPGTVTLHGSDLVGIAADTLTDSQSSVLASRKFNYYTTVRGVGNFFWNGFVPNGEFADLVRFKLWLEARVQESVATLFKNRTASTGGKIPYNADGEAAVEGAISEVLELAYTRGATSLDDKGRKYVITFPDTQLSTDKANRLLNDVEFSVVYSNAVHKVIIRGYVTL